MLEAGLLDPNMIFHFGSGISPVWSWRIIKPFARAQFRDKLNATCVGWEIVNDYLNVENVLSHSLYKRFEEKLSTLEGLDTDYLKKTVIEVFTEMLAGRKIE